MEWQQLTSLLIVGITGGLLAARVFRRRRYGLGQHTHCGCGAAGQGIRSGSIVFRARKGERPEVRVKMK
jgi:hypothetical protein